MDTQLESLMRQGAEKQTIYVNAGRATIELRDPDHPGEAQEYSLKPLPELYGSGIGSQSIDLQDQAYLPLLMSIEETFVMAYRNNPSLTDGAVLLVLDKLCMSPETAAGPDEIATSLQTNLRLTLSLNDYSRQDVRQALRKIKQSANRHNKLGGRRGYLEFISKMLGGGRRA